ncbi:hypothetical protein FRC14_003306 [Serendipita sp. 396]|nr:hypothetical protein FRC14_003306 [Serendipita sp. 396]KAG8780593.1 hypothetical protein FRC15_009474 [Serendipita sp. 397]KAG8797462.1 hypothetical protein FRC16_008828 [Serendipita sp. 398]KAG8814946.1 hypothetical protein FRC19_001377 [Serendipita sp. 401]KAG8830243.1 hypothetical protein FRC18_008486 [Serendipita sp. 400]KAG8847370.1 hypothetical protein FRB91_011856 [Serendipita sp. 411]KAG8866024.1 hypothetical protein FRC20_009163 [Serendipita sp. 405]KAG9046852.1 hypothetical prot
MSNLDRSSSDKNFGTFLPDYIEDLRRKNKLTDEFKGKNLEKLSNEFVKGLSNLSKSKLGIQSIDSTIGVTVLDEDDGFRYVTACAAKLTDGEVKLLVVNRPPDSKSIFQVPDQGPPVVLASTTTATAKPHGFKSLNEPALIAPVWKPFANQGFVMTYSYNRGVPLVGHQLSGTFEPAPFSWKLTQYCAYDPGNPNEIGEERFIFTGFSKDSKNTHRLQGYYMRLEDLRRRVETDNASVAIKEDMKRYKAEKPLYDLWHPNGDLVDPTESQNAFRSFEPKDSDGNDEVSHAKSLFQSHCKIARQARLNGGLYDVLSRFWDGAWEPDFFLQIDPQYQTQIRKSADAHFQSEEKKKELETRTFDPDPIKEDRSLMALIEDKKVGRTFKPKFTIVWSRGEIDKHPLLITREPWASHPNSLYRLWMDSYTSNPSLISNKVDVLRPERKWPTKDELKDADDRIQTGLEPLKTYKDRTGAATTVTEVTKTSMNIVKNYKRRPDQVGAMGKVSPNDLVATWWKLQPKEKAAEWLHRSAWSYGGLHNSEQSEKVDPQSSQVMSNLIIGTHEANTMMIRDEIFVKRLVEYAKDGDDKDIKVHVTTTLQEMFADDVPKYGWSCTKLQYEVEALGTSKPPAKFTSYFFPFTRRLPTRLELDLDELFESLIYGWGDSNFMALYSDDEKDVE